MAIQFAANGFFNTGSTPVNSHPLTLSCWAYIPASVDSSLFRIHDTAASQNFFMINSFSNKIRASVRVAGGTSAFAESATYTANTWIHLCAVFTSTASRTIYLDGTATTNTTSGVTNSSANLNQVRLNHGASGANIRIAEAAIWNLALTAAEVSSLSKGFQSNLIRPDNLVFYSPLIRDRNEISGGRALTENGTITRTEHPRIYGL